jgi:hypothetical protein
MGNYAAAAGCAILIAASSWMLVNEPSRDGHDSPPPANSPAPPAVETPAVETPAVETPAVETPASKATPGPAEPPPPASAVSSEPPRIDPPELPRGGPEDAGELSPEPSFEDLIEVTNEPMPEWRAVPLFGGAVELAMPEDWEARPWPAAREARYLVLPRSAPPGEGPPDDGAWIMLHLRAEERAESLDDLKAWLRRRLALATENRAVAGEVEETRLGPFTALRLPYAQPDPTGGEPGGGSRGGTHVLIRGEGVLVEWHAATSGEKLASRSREFDRMLAGMRLAPPRAAVAAPNDEIRDAASILGSWRAPRSTMRLFGDGRIVIEIDRLGVRPDDAAKGGVPMRRLTGQFRARGDVLLVRWDDGSLQNFRWRVDAGELLLTDHSGQISQLVRKFE